MKESAGSPAPSDAPPSFLRAWAELAGLWALAIAWPVYQQIGSGPEALTVLGIRRLDLLVLVAFLSFLIPLVLVLPERLARLFSPRVAGLTHSIVVGLLAGQIVWAAFQPGFLAILLGGATLVAATLLRFRTGFGKSFAGIIAVATPVTIVLFLISYPVTAALLPGEPGAEPGEASADSPVVLVVLDELPLATLVNGEDRIDGRLFPNFARLEREGTWYRQATSLTDHTLSALPSILTGEDPRAEPTFGEPTPPGYPDNPDTVCSVAERAGYQGFASQSGTDLCARSTSLPSRIFALLFQAIPSQVPDTYEDLLGDAFPTEKMTPGRIFESGVEAVSDLFGRPRPVWGTERDRTVEDFTREMPASPGTINLIHTSLPHADYQYRADGTVYANRWLFDAETVANLGSPKNPRESAKNLQQLTEQTMYVDRLLGRMIARLERDGVWEETMFVVVADHGASFAPGTKRRNLSEENSGWLLPVPLFIKYPGQARGQITDRAADIRDVTPTILDVLGLDPSPRATGSSLLGKAAAPDQVLKAIGAGGDPVELSRRVVEKKRRAAIKFRNEYLGSGLFALGGHAGLIGLPVSRLRGRPVPFTPQSGLGFDTESFEAGARPNYFQAELDAVDNDPGPLAIALDGEVVATTRAWKRDGRWMTGLNLPIDPDVERMPEVSIFRIRP